MQVSNKMITALNSTFVELGNNAVKELPFPLRLSGGFEWVYFLVSKTEYKPYVF